MPTEDPQIEQELAESAYHMLWELVHVFLDGAAPAGPRRDAGAAGFLYPSLTGARQPLEPLLEEVRASVASKASEISELRAQTLGENALELAAAARTLRESCERGARLLALGNGGSATDAMDLVADVRSPPGEGIRAAAIDLSEDSAILTATANDVGVEAIFSRQVIAYGRPATCWSHSPPRATPRTCWRRSPRRAGADCTRSPWWATAAAASRRRRSPTT